MAVRYGSARMNVTPDLHSSYQRRAQLHNGTTKAFKYFGCIMLVPRLRERQSKSEKATLLSTLAPRFQILTFNRLKDFYRNGCVKFFAAID